LSLNVINDTDRYIGYGVYLQPDPELDQLVLKVSREGTVHFIAITDGELLLINEAAAKMGFASAKGGVKSG
jgi:hypothetical protein